jgi:SPX domain protein involved in polyphosphate accumulation
VDKQIRMNRNELKFYVDRRNAAGLREFLKGNMYLDSNAGETGSYCIRSLYFDTVDNNDYYDKILGCSIRKKIRLRVYNYSRDVVKLELKNRYSSCIYKESTNIMSEEADRLIKGDCSFLLNYNEQAAGKIFAFMHQSLYRPKLLIDYEREAYLYPVQNIRITIDKNVRVNTSSFDLFDKSVCMTPVLNKELYILEIKYDHMLPGFLRRVISGFEARRSEISKYCLGRSILK